MKPEFKVEGDKLKIKFEHGISKEYSVDSDHDQEASVKAKLKADMSAEFEMDGSETLDEMFKSSALIEKAKQKLIDMGIIKG